MGRKGAGKTAGGLTGLSASGNMIRQEKAREVAWRRLRNGVPIDTTTGGEPLVVKGLPEELASKCQGIDGAHCEAELVILSSDPFSPSVRSRIAPSGATFTSRSRP